MASADDPYEDAGARAATRAAGALRRGRLARDAGRLVEAEAAFEEALKAAEAAWTTDAERASIAAELGLCELALQRHREAAGHLAQSLEHRGALSPWILRRVQEGLASAEKRVATLYVTTSPPGAEVFLDGEALGRVEPVHEVYLDPGDHNSRARLEGHTDAVRSFRAEAGQSHALVLRLRRAPEPVAKAPEAAPPAPPAPPAAPAPPPLPLAELRIGGVALTTAAAAAGAVFLLRASVVRGDLAERDVALRRGGWDPSACQGAGASPVCAELRGLREERNLLGALGAASLVTSGVFAAATAAWFLTDPPPAGGAPARQGVRVVPVMTGNQAWLSLQGTF
ncbi:PEGA domain-containing protein [Sorangium sp. So ce131]|uniref:PEGA domain-containing protein n=1 Tax=Sorangium sp. So ce131 TaxID=3133282 RepID=UPI003F642346